ncbi:MAG: transporter [Gemmatimonadota bacterium]
MVACAALGGVPLRAQAPIQDNSFLIEEAYNQERGVVQHISTFDNGDAESWEYAFTQEWSLGGIRHQLGYTLPVLNAGRGSGIGDVGVNYRHQVVGNPDARLLVAPRLTLLLPTGSHEEARGSGGAGVQLNLPLTYVATPQLVTHWNAGVTLIPSASAPAGGSASATSVNLGAGVVWLLRRSVNLLFEGVWTSDAAAVGDGVTVRDANAWVSPGIRAAFNAGAVQVVPGVAYVIGIGPSRGESLFLYLSLEHAFSK